jgi:glutathione S-transferase
MITLYTAPPLWGLPSMSPACLKLETWLRIAKIPYQAVTVSASNFEQAPKGKIPFIEYQGKFFGDSSLIIEMLKQTEGIDLDANLSASERAISLAFRRMLKENTYWGAVYIRYGIEENWQQYRKVLANILFPDTPETEWSEFIEGLREISAAQLDNQGMGRHSAEEITQIICADIQALSDFLADKSFFMGEQPTTLDATAYGYIGNFIKAPYQSPMVDYILQCSNLCTHSEQMTQQFFSEFL